MKNIRITESCSAGSKTFEEGKTYKDIDTKLAAELVGSGRAVEVRTAKEEAVETRDPVPENRDPEPAPSEDPKPPAKKAAKKTDK